MTRPIEAGAATARPADEGRPRPTRRAVLRGAAGASVAAATVAAGGAAALAASAAPRTETDRQAAQTSPVDEDQAIVAHLRDARSGEIDVFRGTGQVRVTDHELAARLIRASRP
jgi:hypothetical protein